MQNILYLCRRIRLIWPHSGLDRRAKCRLGLVGGDMGEWARLSVSPVARICVPLGLALGVLTVLAACSSTDPVRTISSTGPVSPSPIGPPPASIIAEEGEPIRKGKGYYKLGPPYSINGETYIPAVDPKYRADGVASWYGADFHGKETANGEIYDMQGIS